MGTDVVLMHEQELVVVLAELGVGKEANLFACWGIFVIERGVTFTA